MENTKKCPITGCFCWKNPLQVVVLLAALPFAVKGIAWVAKFVVTCCG